MSGTAANGVDHGSLSGTAVIPVGATFVDITVTPLNDALAEDKETVTVSLVDDVSYQVLTRSGTATLYDDEKPTVDISRLTSSVTEGAAAVFGVPGCVGVRSDSEQAGGGVIHLEWHGSGRQGLHGAATYTATIATGATYVDISITTLDNGVADGTRTLILTLVGDLAIQLGTSLATISILSIE